MRIIYAVNSRVPEIKIVVKSVGHILHRPSHSQETDTVCILFLLLVRNKVFISFSNMTYIEKPFKDDITVEF